MTDTAKGPGSRLERTLLGGDRELDRQEVARRAGVPMERTRQLWRAMGFVDVDDGVVAFTEGDVRALRDLSRLEELGVLDDGVALVLTRSMGQALGRLAETHAAITTDVLAVRTAAALGPDPDPAAVIDAATTAAQTALPIVEDLLVYVWRRQLAAAAGRLLGGEGEATHRTAAVGFFDIVGFTGLTRSLSEPELGALLERFEATASDRIARLGGRVVKTLGDEVLFVADEIGPAAEIALCTLAEHAAAEELPEVRVGLAWGGVLTRQGDVYGGTVNIASRLTGLARPGTVLVDREAAELLAERPAYDVHYLSRRSVGGYRHLLPARLRHASQG